jgi:adenine-specific DNA-methyltransferase
MAKQLGQFFTKNKDLQNFVVSSIKNKPHLILEPSIGRGDLVMSVLNYHDGVHVDMYEIDGSIHLLEGITKDNVIYGDFLKQTIQKKYKTIIGNPPYVKKTGGGMNLYLQFTSKCFELLDVHGELVFIVPSDFFKLTSASKLLSKMMEQGSFTNIYHPHNENLFDEASIDVIVYRYEKDVHSNVVVYNHENTFLHNKNGVITFSKDISDDVFYVSDAFDVYVGIVSGMDAVYKNQQFGNVEILNSREQKAKYVMVDTFPTQDTKLNDYLLENKAALMTRKIKKFNESNWFEWGALRNINKMKTSTEPCIYMKNLTRQDNVCFIEKTSYFGGDLLMLKPKQWISKNPDALNKYMEYFNSSKFKEPYMYSGRFKIGQRLIVNSQIPKLFHT